MKGKIVQLKDNKTQEKFYPNILPYNIKNDTLEMDFTFPHTLTEEEKEKLKYFDWVTEIVSDNLKEFDTLFLHLNTGSPLLLEHFWSGRGDLIGEVIDGVFSFPYEISTSELPILIWVNALYDSTPFGVKIHEGDPTGLYLSEYTGVRYSLLGPLSESEEYNPLYGKQGRHLAITNYQGSTSLSSAQKEQLKNIKFSFTQGGEVILPTKHQIIPLLFDNYNTEKPKKFAALSGKVNWERVKTLALTTHNPIESEETATFMAVEGKITFSLKENDKTFNSTFIQNSLAKNIGYQELIYKKYETKSGILRIGRTNYSFSLRVNYYPMVVNTTLTFSNIDFSKTESETDTSVPSFFFIPRYDGTNPHLKAQDELWGVEIATYPVTVIKNDSTWNKPLGLQVLNNVGLASFVCQNEDLTWSVIDRELEGFKGSIEVTIPCHWNLP